MSPVNGDIQDAKLWQQNMRDLDLDLRKIKDELHGESTNRKRAAYTLKFIAIFGALAISTGFLNALVAQLVALTIAVAVGIDQWLTNHAKMLAVDAGDKAMRALIATTQYKHKEAISPAVIAAADQDPAAAKLLVAAIRGVHQYAFDGKEAILKKVEEADTVALKKLTVEVDAARQ